MRTQLLAATALGTTIGFLVPGLALAQGPTPFDWSGFYTGISAGVVTSQSTIDFDGFDGSDYPKHLDLPELGKDGTVRFGYNWQTGQFVYGLEQDLSIVSLSGTHSGGTYPGSNYSVQDSLNSLLSMRARFGVAFDRLMVFATAGVAAGHASFVSDVGYNLAPASASDTVLGGVFGGGMEYAVTDNLSLTATALYYDLASLHGVGDAGYDAVGFHVPYTATYSPHGAVFEAGLNLHF